MREKKSRNIMFWCLKKYKNKCIEFNRLLFFWESWQRDNAAPLCSQCNGRKMKHKENIYIKQRTSSSHFVTPNGTVHVHKRYVQNIREPPLGNHALPTSHWIFVATRTRATQYTLDQMLQWIYYLIGTLPLPLSQTAEFVPLHQFVLCFQEISRHIVRHHSSGDEAAKTLLKFLSRKLKKTSKQRL